MEESNNEAMAVGLELLEERREMAFVRMIAQKQKVERYFNRKTNLRHFMVGDYVLRKVTLATRDASRRSLKSSSTLKKNAEITASDEGFNNFKKEHLNICIAELYDILVSAHYLKIKDLVDICAWAIYDKIKNKSIKAITEMLEIENDLTPVEEANINKETSGAFEGDENDNTINWGSNNIW
ncbi:SKP1-like protein 14 [Lycium ferocissimum]|uniref:SKP1-like protein 14 n=1 Tax=Lycium ferocissimum TaxID=112874 RepID=UPI0028155981|nr:SKP1-like protein 14 [Lycium ferocissimum]